MKKTYSFSLLIIILFIILAISMILAVSIGSSHIPFSEVLNVLFNEIFNNSSEYNATRDIIVFIRLPRVILALAVGIGLSICGCIMQATVKNQIADPYILGVSSGASLGATLAILLGVGVSFGSNYIGLMAFLGAFLVSLLVLFLSNIGSRNNSLKLLLFGMAINSLCSSFSSAIIYFANDANEIKDVTFWLMGSLAGADYETILIILPLTLVCAIFFTSQYRVLNLMLLGDEVSITLGTDLAKYRNLYLIISSLVIGFIVYASGMIGFVGLIIPHIARILVGTNHLKLIPVSALLGAILLVLSDLLCRVIIKNNELPIGILIALIGAPCFIYLMIKKNGGSYENLYK